MAIAARAERQRAHWLRHRRPLLELAGRLPASAAGFRPWDQAMTTAVLVAHVARATHRFVSAVERGALEPRAPGAAPPPAPETMDEAVALLRRLTDEDTEAFERLDDGRLDARLEFGPMGTVAGEMLLALAVDHEIHHKGQLWTYARMCGVEPPPFAARGA
jgi:uncharacterized damage-inducible protein DinB